MAKMKAMAHIIQFDDGGQTTAKAVRLYATLCSSEEPQTFEIPLDDTKHGHHRSIRITRDQIEQVLADNPY